MTTNGRVIKSFGDYKKLSNDQKEFWQFEQLNKISNLETKFASKWVEKAFITFVTMVMIAFAGAAIAGVISSPI